MPSLQIEFDSSATDFLTHAGPLLYRDEAINSLMLGICEGLQQTPDAGPLLFVRGVQDGVTLFAGFQFNGMYLILSHATKTHLEVLAQALQQRSLSLPGVVGPASTAQIFAETWARLQTCEFRLGMGQNIYGLTKVVSPESTTGFQKRGHLRAARPNELELVCSWGLAFGQESLPHLSAAEASRMRQVAEKGVKNQTVYLWDVDGRAVAMAFATRPTRHTIAVSYVYTPPVERRKGFASFLVADLSQKMLDDGKTACVLYTDLANPTSNKIYQRLGYKEVAESKLFLFS